MSLTQKDVAAFAAVAETLLPSVPGDGPAWTTPGGSWEWRTNSR